ncbi:hypothetical protein Y032_0017g3190 [Ancylostoma ceylanicum]|nr:hypothetical protein Y032_0017g3190 [Ancylostoma ceylanicum]
MSAMEQRPGPSFEPLGRIGAILTSTNFFTHIFGCFLMTVNRWMTICHPNMYEVLWKKRRVMVMLIVEILISYGISARTFVTKVTYEKNENGEPEKLEGETPLSEVRLTTSIVVIVYEVVSIVLIALTLYKIKKVMKHDHRKKRLREVGGFLLHIQIVLRKMLDFQWGLLFISARGRPRAGAWLVTLLFHWDPCSYVDAAKKTEKYSVVVVGTIFCGKALSGAQINVRYKLVEEGVPPDTETDKFGEFLVEVKEAKKKDVESHVWIRGKCDNYCLFGFPLNIPRSSFSAQPGNADTVIDVGAVQLKDTEKEKFIERHECED